jgi:predicted lipid-binding transport protein (Tim44 family)
MHPAIKILIGALMVVLGIFSLTVESFFQAFMTLIKGGIGPILILVGAFIIWLESDEWKMRRKESGEERDNMGVQQQLQEEVKERREAEEKEEAEEDKHACPQCGKEFDTERGMKIHQTQKHD